MIVGDTTTPIHLEDVPAFQAGDTVTAGSTVLGYINTGESTHLHFVDGILNQNTYNPLYYIYPFEDFENPVIEYVKVVSNLGDDDTPTELSVISYNEKVDIIVRARDVISLPYQINNGVYFVNTSIFDPDGIQVANFSSILFWSGGNNGIWDVKKIYAKGSSASSSLSGIYIYISTNTLNADDYWWNTVENDGYYTIQVVVRDVMWNEDSQTKTIWVEGSAKMEEKKH